MEAVKLTLTTLTQRRSVRRPAKESRVTHTLHTGMFFQDIFRFTVTWILPPCAGTSGSHNALLPRFPTPVIIHYRVKTLKTTLFMSKALILRVFAGSSPPHDSTPPPNKRAPKALHADHSTVTRSGLGLVGLG